MKIIHEEDHNNDAQDIWNVDLEDDDKELDPDLLDAILEGIEDDIKEAELEAEFENDEDDV